MATKEIQESQQEQAIRAASQEKLLLPAKKLVHDLFMVRGITTEAVVSLLRDQYQIAVERKYWTWVKELRKYGDSLLSQKTLDDYFPVPWTTKKPIQKSVYKRVQELEMGCMVKDVRLLTQDLPVAQGDAASQNIEILPHALMEPRKTQNNPRVEISSAEDKEKVRGTTETSITAEVPCPRHQRSQGNTSSCSLRHNTSRRREGIQICSPRQQRSSGKEHRSHSPRHVKSRGRDDSKNRHPQHKRTREEVHRSRSPRHKKSGRENRNDHSPEAKKKFREKGDSSHSSSYYRYEGRGFARHGSPRHYRSRIQEYEGTHFLRHYRSRRERTVYSSQWKRKFHPLQDVPWDKEARQERSRDKKPESRKEYRIPETLVFYPSKDKHVKAGEEKIDPRQPKSGIFQTHERHRTNQSEDLTIQVEEGTRLVRCSRKRKVSPEVRQSKLDCKRIKRTKCPFPGCDAEARRVKRHVQQKHIPAIFHDLETEELMRSQEFQGKRLEALQVLADIIMVQCEEPTPESLRKMTDKNLLIDPSSEITASTQKAMARLCQYAGWEVPKQFTLVPTINSPAVLIHWRPMAYIMDHLNEKNSKMMFERFGPETRDVIALKSDMGKKNRLNPARRKALWKKKNVCATVTRTSSPTEVSDSAIKASSTSVGTEKGVSPKEPSKEQAEEQMEVDQQQETPSVPESNPKDEGGTAAQTQRGPTVAILSGDKIMETTSLSAFEVEKNLGKGIRLVIGSPETTTEELDYHCSPSPDKVKNLSQEEEEILLRSSSEASNSPGEGAGKFKSSPKQLVGMQTYAEVVKEGAGVVKSSSQLPSRNRSYADVVKTKLAVGIVKPQASPTHTSGSKAEALTLAQAYDSHFHLDRLGAKLGVNPSDADSLVRKVTEIPPTHKVNVAGGVLVYCDPERYNEIYLDADRKWAIAVGIHPKKTEQLTAENQAKLKLLLDNPRVNAMGEVGLDYSVDRPSREVQQKVLTDILTFSRPQKVLVLHIRGSAEDPFSTEPSKDCLAIVQKMCQPEQKIHLHCFAGQKEQVWEWRRAFPDCHFGFTGKMARFRKEQREALKSIPLDRILVETDSPYLPVLPGQRINTPAYIGDVAAEAAKIRQEPIELVIETTRVNGQKLYGH